MDEHKIRTEYVNRDRQVISDVLKNRFYPMVSSRSKDSYIFDVEDHKCLDMTCRHCTASVHHCRKFTFMCTGYRKHQTVRGK